LKRGDGVYKRSNAPMDKSFDGRHENNDFDSIQFLVKKNDFDFDDRNISIKNE